jgi:hypothetical protein
MRVTVILREKEQHYGMPYWLLFSMKWRASDVLLGGNVRLGLYSDHYSSGWPFPEINLILYADIYGKGEVAAFKYVNVLNTKSAYYMRSRVNEGRVNHGIDTFL